MLHLEFRVYCSIHQFSHLVWGYYLVLHRSDKDNGLFHEHDAGDRRPRVFQEEAERWDKGHQKSDHIADVGKSVL